MNIATNRSRGQRLAWLALALAAAALPAAAMTVMPASASAPPRGLVKPTPGAKAARSQPSLDLVTGTIGRIDLARKVLVVSGVPLTWTSNRLHVFSRGVRASEFELRAGQKIRFATEPGVAESRKVVLVYMEGS